MQYPNRQQQLINNAIQTEYPQQQPPTLYTVEQFAIIEPAFTPAALRNLIFRAESRQTSKGKLSGNGLLECGAVIRVGRKVLIDGEKFINWVREQNGGE